jgi:DNA-binding GntR family transcriptional regulator
MNSGATSERVYDALKHRILHRMFRPGDRLDPAILGQALSSSVTPVRDALHILAGERLVTTRTGDGFHMPALDAPALEDLYAWNGQVLDLALRVGAGATLSPPGEAPSGYADRVARLFGRIAERTGNCEHRTAIEALNDRLHAARIAEAEILPDCIAELAELAALSVDDRAKLRQALAPYHRRRRRAAAAIVRALYRARLG